MHLSRAALPKPSPTARDPRRSYVAAVPVSAFKPVVKCGNLPVGMPNLCFAVASLLMVLNPLYAGITYRLRFDGPGSVVFTVWADGSAYRAQAEAPEGLSDFQRQYPIVISTDGGMTRRHLRPEDKTWYEEPGRATRGSIAIGANPSVHESTVTLIEESSTDGITARGTRQFVLKASCVIQSEIGSEKVRLHKSVTALLLVTNIACAPKVAEQLERLTFGIPDIDDQIRSKMASIDGLIVHETISRTERYDGGPPRTSIINAEVVNPRCLDVNPALFAVPKDYRRQEPVVGGPG
jgi:hypothetical protein